jgi:hypothetical protein
MRYLLVLSLLLSTTSFAQVGGQSSWSGPVTFRNTVTIQGQTYASAPINASGGVVATDVSTQTLEAPTATLGDTTTNNLNASTVSTSSLQVMGNAGFAAPPTGIVNKSCVTVTNDLGVSVLGCKVVTQVPAAFLHLGRACEAVGPTTLNINTDARCRVTAEGVATLYACAPLAGLAIANGQWCAETTN